MTKGIVCSLLTYLTCISGLWASNAFTDLDFESATLVSVPGDPYNRVYFDLALPGWSGFSATNQLDRVLYDSVILDSTSISIFDRNTNYQYNGSAVIQGNYTVALYAGLSLYDNMPADASLSQTGLVPPGTKSVSFLARAYGPFTVSLGGVGLNLISFPVTNQTYNLYEADVSAFAGQSAALTFTVFAQNPYNNSIRSLYLDSIQFSPDTIADPIPEPSGLSLLVIGVVALGCWRVTYRKTA